VLKTVSSKECVTVLLKLNRELRHVREHFGIHSVQNWILPFRKSC